MDDIFDYYEQPLDEVCMFLPHVLLSQEILQSMMDELGKTYALNCTPSNGFF